MSQVESIKQLWSIGKSVSEISRALQVDRNTVYKYIRKDDFDEPLKTYSRRGSKMDAYRSEIEEMLKAETGWFRKQRHTARRIAELLSQKHPEFDCGYSTVAKYVAEVKRNMRRASQGYGTLSLVWNPGEAQADFGEADFLVEGRLERLKYFNLTFPYSGGIFTVLSEGENCECVCCCLYQIFEYIGGVPTRIVFDNATGIGGRVFGAMQETELFTRFRLHYGFRSSFANPRSGHEKGSVENSIGDVRRNLFVPPLDVFRPLSSFNARVMLDMSSGFKREQLHYRREEAIGDLFRKDMEAMNELNLAEFTIERRNVARLSQTGSIRLDSRYEYVLGPGMSGSSVIIGRRAETIRFYSMDGVLIKEFERSYGSDPVVSYNMEAMLKGIVLKPNSWFNSPIRSEMEDGRLKNYIDAAEPQERRRMLGILSRNVEEFGFGISFVAAEGLFDKGRVPTVEDLSSYSRRLQELSPSSSENATGVDLGMFDTLMKGV